MQHRRLAGVWLTDPESVHAAAPEGHGALRNRDIATLVLETVASLVAPGLEHVGIDARSARAWLARHASG